MREDGAVSALVIALLALAALLCLAMADAANVLVSRARARSAADAAALAAAVAQWPFASRDEQPYEAAERVAEANGAKLESCDCSQRGESAFVTVSISTRIRMLGVAPSRVRASARASFDVGRLFEAS